MESTLDEVIFVVGPVIATVIATQVDPVLVLYLAAALVLGGALWLSTLRGSEPPPRVPDGAPHRAAVLTTGMPLLTLFAVAMGVIFASAEVTIVAFCGQHGHRGLSGAVLAALAGGSASAGFLYGARRWKRPLLDRFRLQAVIFGLLPLLFLAATNIGVLAACAFVVGAGIAPTLITAFGADRAAGAGRVAHRGVGLADHRAVDRLRHRRLAGGPDRRRVRGAHRVHRDDRRRAGDGRAGARRARPAAARARRSRRSRVGS